MANKIQIRRGNKVNLPTLSAGEPAFCTDTKQLFVGTGNNNIEYAKQSEVSALNTKVNSNTSQLNEIMNKRGYVTVNRLNEGTDLNTVTNSGQYAATKLVNSPQDNVWFFIEVFNCGDGSNYVIQRAMGFADGGRQVFERQKNLSWSDWKRVSNDYVILTLLNGWSKAIGDMNNSASYSGDDIVTINFSMKGGTVTENTVIAVLPENYRPSSNLVLPALTNWSNKQRPFFVSIKMSGEITIRDTLNNTDYYIFSTSFSRK